MGKTRLIAETGAGQHGVATDENAGVESARLAERETEAALRGLRHAQRSLPILYV